MIVIVCLLAFVSTAIACSCLIPDIKDAFCFADIVSHVKVLSFHEQGNNSYMSDSLYELRHLLVYKPPVTGFDSLVYTPSDDLCGLKMEVGKEYLVTAFRERGNIHVYRCGQVNDRNLTGAIEWSTVSKELHSKLKAFPVLNYIAEHNE